MSGQVPSGSSACSAWLKQFQGPLDRHFVRRRLVGQAGPALALFQERSIAADADEDRSCPSGWPRRMRLTSRASISSALFCSCCFEPGLAVAEIELPQIVDVPRLAAADRVQIVFHLGREAVVDQVRQMGFEQLRHGERDPSRNQRPAFLEDVFARQDRVDDRGVRARPADAQFFQRPGERGFAEAARRLRGVVSSAPARWQASVSPTVTLGSSTFVFGQSGFRVVAPFDIGPQVAGKIDRLAARPGRRLRRLRR